MGKTKTVAVDAEAVKKAMEWAGQSALDSCDEEADELYELSAALTPIVPTLPEGATEKRDSESLTVTWADGNEYAISDDGIGTCDYDRYDVPLDAATYLLHAWSNR